MIDRNIPMFTQNAILHPTSWQYGLTQARYIKSEYVAAMYNRTGNPHITVSTAKRYMNGGKAFKNGPPKAFKEFLENFTTHLRQYWKNPS